VSPSASTTVDRAALGVHRPTRCRHSADTATTSWGRYDGQDDTTMMKTTMTLAASSSRACRTSCESRGGRMRQEYTTLPVPGGAASAYVTPSAPFADAHPHLTARRAVTRLGTLEEYHTARFRAARSTIYDVGVAHATGH
jgi:hypothetical protein